MSNRYTDWAIIYSPSDKSLICETLINQLLKILKKNCTLYSVSYEEGSQGTNPHIDIVASFKSKQARGDLVDKLHTLLGNMKRPSTDLTKILDMKQRIGYNLKESLEFPFPVSHLDHELIFGITDQFKQECLDYYSNWTKEQSKVKGIKNNFKYVNTKTCLHTINKYIIEKEETITTPQSFITIIKAMTLDGYYFDMNSDRKREICKVYLAWAKQDVSDIDFSDWLEEPTHLCSKCQYICSK